MKTVLNRTPRSVKFSNRVNLDPYTKSFGVGIDKKIICGMIKISTKGGLVQMQKRTLKDGVVSNPEIAGLLHGHWEGEHPNGPALFFVDGQLVAKRDGWTLYVVPALAKLVDKVCSK